MRHLVVPTAVAGIHFVATVACMCSSTAGMVDAAAVLVLPDIHCLLAVGGANFSVSVVADVVADGVATWVLSDYVLSTPLVFPVQTLPSPYFLSFSILVQPMFHLATFYAVRACMHLRTCGHHLF